MPVATADSAPSAGTSPPADQLDELDVQHARERRALADKAHAANLELGERLLTELATVDPCEVAVARFFVYALLGEDTRHDEGPDDPVSAIALRGIRLAVDEFRQDTTTTEQDSDADTPRVVCGDGRDHAELARWLWSYLAGAKTAGELFGRALVVIAAERYASRLVLPQSQQHAPLRWPSHKNTAEKALHKLVGPHIAPTLKALERAIAKAKTDYEEDRRRIVTERNDNPTAEHAAPEPPATSATRGADSGTQPVSDSVASGAPPTQSATADAPRQEPTNGRAVLTSTGDPAGGATSAPEGAVDAGQEIDF